MSKYAYTSEKDESGHYFIQFVDFETGFTEAFTQEGVAQAAKEVLEVLVEAYKDDGLELPKASPVGSNAFVEI